MLETWRPPDGAGDPIGCIATTYTFSPGLFDEQCLARFLEIGSDPDREDLPFLLERESRLGSVYAGVLVDHTQAGVEHSLRWDVLPVRLPGGKQHAKISLLAWSQCIRIVVSSANLSDAGYRTNLEVTDAIDVTPAHADVDLLTAATGFLRMLLGFVPGAIHGLPEVRRAEVFLEQLDERARDWTPTRRRGRVRRHLVFTLPSGAGGEQRLSSLQDTLSYCRRHGKAPGEAWIASPFFDVDEDESPLTAALCKLMARKTTRRLHFCVPELRANEESATRRLAAPRGLALTPPRFHAKVTVDALPNCDEDGNQRFWHAKMLALRADGYSALMIGSSNFTRAGMGIGPHRNAEANLVTIVDRVRHGREVGALEAVWPSMDPVKDLDAVEWIGAQPDSMEEEQTTTPPLPAGFLAATYHAGVHRRITIRLDPAALPGQWSIRSCGRDAHTLIEASTWRTNGSPEYVELDWAPAEPPNRLLVEWEQYEAFLPLNVEDAAQLPPPSQTEGMSADDLLWILAAADPGAAFRAWTRRHDPGDTLDDDLDSATPVDLDPLRRYDLSTTFLHRIRQRGRAMARLRSNLERPVWNAQQLQWRLRGFIGIGAVADRLARHFEGSDGNADEALLGLADFLIVLHQVNYTPDDKGLSRDQFDRVYHPFLAELAGELDDRIANRTIRVSRDVLSFWKRVVRRCRA